MSRGNKFSLESRHIFKIILIWIFPKNWYIYTFRSHNKQKRVTLDAKNKVSRAWIRDIPNLPGRYQHNPGSHSFSPLRVCCGPRESLWRAAYHPNRTCHHYSHSAGDRGDRHQPESGGRRRVFHHQPLLREYDRGHYRHLPLLFTSHISCFLYDRLFNSDLCSPGSRPRQG